MSHPFRPADPALARASDAIGAEMAGFASRCCRGSQIGTEAIRSQLAQGLLDGEVAAFGCVLFIPDLQPLDEGPRRLVLAALRLRVVRRPFPVLEPSPLRPRPQWAERGVLRLLLERGDPLRKGGPREREWFLTSSPLTWRPSQVPLAFFGSMALDRLTMLDGDRALVREAYDVSAVQSGSVARLWEAPR